MIMLTFLYTDITSTLSDLSGHEFIWHAISNWTKKLSKLSELPAKLSGNTVLKFDMI